MRNIANRLDRLEKALGEKDSLCAGDTMHKTAIVYVQPGWTEEQIREAEDAARIRCPLHGLTEPVIRFSPRIARL
jgi:hypothetical protein